MKMQLYPIAAIAFKQIAQSNNIKQNLKLICKFCIKNDYGETYSAYCDKATKDNIASIVITTAKD